MPPFLAILTVLFAVCCYLLKPSPYAPGPRRLPLVGNAFDIPAVRPWLKFSVWSAIYGDVLYLRIFRRHIVVLNSIQAATDLYEKRAEIYSDRPQRAMATLCGFGRTMLLRKYDADAKLSRRLLQGQLNTRAVSAYASVQEQQALVLARNMLTFPADFRAHIRSMATSVILMVAYGYEVEDRNDSLVLLAQEVMGSLSVAVAPNRYWVDSIPILRLIPSWLPGATFQREAAACREIVSRFMSEPFSRVQRELETGNAVPSYVSNLLSSTRSSSGKNMDEIYKWTAGEIYGAGSDTTVSTISSFVLAMILFPEVQRKAQEELDSVVGSSRLPTFADRGSLPYVNAVVKEALRWNPVTSSIGRTAREDDHYRGYFIPAGTLVMANVWGITHDPATYPEPTKFMPERYLDSVAPCPDPRNVVFGFGKRSCVGRHLAEGMIFIAVATILSSFSLAPKTDEHGKADAYEVEYTSGAFSHPGPFKCNIRLRNPDIEAVIRSS